MKQSTKYDLKSVGYVIWITVLAWIPIAVVTFLIALLFGAR